MLILADTYEYFCLSVSATGRFEFTWPTDLTKFWIIETKSNLLSPTVEITEHSTWLAELSRLSLGC